MTIEQVLWDGLLSGASHLPDVPVEDLTDLIIERVEAQVEDAHRVIAIEDCAPVREAARGLKWPPLIAATLGLAFALGWWANPNDPPVNTYVIVPGPAASQEPQTLDPVSPAQAVHPTSPTKCPLPLCPQPSLLPAVQTMSG